MYEITGVYQIKIAPDNSILRQSTAFKQHLNSEHGVMAFIEEQKPFRAITIKNMDTQEDITEFFLGPR